MNVPMLTTTDNPYDPFTQFEKWYEFDESKGYHSCSLIARVTVLTDNMSEEDEDYQLELAIDEIVKENVLGLYRKVYEGEKLTQNDSK